MIKTKNVKLLFLIICLLIINYKLFYLVQLPGNLGARNNLIIFNIVSIIFCCLELITEKQKFKYTFNGYIIFIFIILIIEFFFTAFKYSNESYITALKEIFPFISLLSYYIFSNYSQKNLAKFLKILITCSSLVAIICLIETVLYTKFGFSLFKFYGFNYGQFNNTDPNNFLRNGRIRLIGSDLIDFTAVLSIGCLFDRKISIPRAMLLFNLFVVFMYEIFASQTRSITIMLCITLLLLWLLNKRSNNILKVLTLGTFIFIPLMYISLKFKMIFINLSDYSYYHRIEEAIFYFNRFESSPIFGNGLLSDKPIFLENYELVHGTNIFGENAYSDVGIIGLLGRFGILGLFLYVGLFIKEVKILKNTRNSLAMAILIITVLSCVNLSLFDAERLPVLAIYMAVLDGIVSNNVIKETL